MIESRIITKYIKIFLKYMNFRNIKIKIPILPILYLIILTFFLSCSSGSSKDSELNNGSQNTYNLEDAVKIGWKMKKGFSTEFPNSTDAKWGFFKGREVALIRYQNSDDAQNYGNTAGSDQTEYIEPIDGIKAYGENVEKTTCRGFAEYQTPYKLNINFYPTEKMFFNQKNNTIFDQKTGTLKNLYSLGDTSEEISETPAAECPRREPLYREFVIEGNIVIMAEPLRGEDSTALIKAIEEIITKLKENYDKN